MPNFKKRSKFDDSEAPPDLMYPDWTKETTRILTVKLTEDEDADDVLRRLKKKHQIVEELLVGLKAEQCLKLIVRIRK